MKYTSQGPAFALARHDGARAASGRRGFFVGWKQPLEKRKWLGTPASVGVSLSLFLKWWYIPQKRAPKMIIFCKENPLVVGYHQIKETPHVQLSFFSSRKLNCFRVMVCFLERGCLNLRCFFWLKDWWCCCRKKEWSIQFKINMFLQWVVQAPNKYLWIRVPFF